jgi:hypothetical protein
MQFGSGIFFEPSRSSLKPSHILHLNIISMNKEVDMSYSDQEGIEEVFAFQTEEIDFFGALVRKEGSKRMVNGRVLFKGGQRWYFKSPPGEKTEVREKLVVLSENIAEFYGASVIHKAFAENIGTEHFLNLLREAKCKLN